MQYLTSRIWTDVLQINDITTDTSLQGQSQVKAFVVSVYDDVFIHLLVVWL